MGKVGGGADAGRSSLLRPTVKPAYYAWASTVKAARHISLAPCASTSARSRSSCLQDELVPTAHEPTNYPVSIAGGPSFRPPPCIVSALGHCLHKGTPHVRPSPMAQPCHKNFFASHKRPTSNFARCTSSQPIFVDRSTLSPYFLTTLSAKHGCKCRFDFPVDGLLCSLCAPFCPLLPLPCSPHRTMSCDMLTPTFVVPTSCWRTRTCVLQLWPRGTPCQRVPYWRFWRRTYLLQ